MDSVSVTTERGDKGESILAAALELFAHKGFYGTVMPEVAELAGVGAGTIYRHFESKEALVNALYQRWKGVWLETLMKDYPHEAPPQERFKVFWGRATRFVRDYPLAFKFLELHHHAPYLDEASRALNEKGCEAGRVFFEEAERLRITKPYPPWLMLAMTWGMLVGLVKANQAGGLELTDEVLEQAERCCWDAIRS
ncbi:MAG: TetR/AcrR family transcriptional regulator [bacterium]